MASLVDIANNALGQVGQRVVIASLDDANESARLCKLSINQAVQEVLRSGKWKPARKDATLVQVSPVPAFGWAYRYQLPNDYLRMVFFNDTNPDDPRLNLFEVRGKQLYTDETIAQIVYVADLTYAGNDVNVSDPILTDLFGQNLAIKLAWALQQSKTLRESLEVTYDRELKRALAADAREERRGLPNRLNDSEWLRARVGSTNG